jgi:aspartate aminotransferase
MRSLSPRIEQLLAPQDRVDGLRDQALRRAGRNFVDLGYANSYDGPSPETLATLRAALEAPTALALQYTPYGGATVPRRLVAEALRQSHGEPFQHQDVVLTPGAMAALNVVFRSLKTEHGPDEVIAVTPCWLDYPTYLENLGLVPRLVPVSASTLRLDLDAIRAAVTPNTRALVLSQPANPSGLLYAESELRELGRILSEAPSQPLLISDECHREVVFEPHTFTAPLAYCDASCVVYSFGKKLALQGQRLGYVAVSPRHPGRAELARLLARLTRVMGFCTPTALMQLALGELLRIPAPVAAIARRRERALSVLNDAGYEVEPSQATFFLYPKAPGGDDTGFCERLAERGVMVLPAAVFHHSGHFRLSLTSSDEMLERGLSVLREIRGAS